MKAFWNGIAVGAGLGVLFAPGRGRDTRKKLLQAIETTLNHHPTRGESEPANKEDSSRLRDLGEDPAGEALVETLNTAKKDELMSVQGIGKATAKRIIKNRPYKSVDEVIDKEVVPETTLDNVKTELVEKTEDVA
jgi:DNA uptake protein ComE-like DNA-binding protein